VNPLIKSLLSPHEQLLLANLSAHYDMPEDLLVAEILRYILMLSAQGGQDHPVNIRQFLDAKFNSSQAVADSVLSTVMKMDQAVSAAEILLSTLHEKAGGIPFPIKTA
jgi:hypothetical protein